MAATTYFKRGAPLTERLLHYTEQLAECGCWVWMGPASDGYGRIKIQGRNIPTHRASYEAFVGPIPKGLELDHLCRVTYCINPKHLEPVTHAENVQRGKAGQYLSSRTHCDYGHLFSPENTTIRPSGARACRACKKIRKQRSELKKHLTPPLQ